jgi:diguanylate cyclase (GGDEF)-like protein
MSRRRLAQLEQSAQEHLRRLQDPAAHADREVILRLLETSCLLELSKLTASQVDLATFVSATVDVLVQFFPVEYCGVILEPEGVPKARAVFGDLPMTDEELQALHGDDEDDDDDEDGDGDPTVFRLNALAQPIGYFIVGGLPSFMTDAGFFATAADQLSAVLGAMVAAERLRRQAALATAIQLAATVDQGADDEQLQALVEAMAALPGVSGARLSVDHPALGAPTHVLAGVFEDQWVDRIHTLDTGVVDVRLFTPGDGADLDRADVDQVLAILAGTLQRMEQERRLMEEVETDPLTGVGNRRRYDKALAAALARAERTGSTVAALALDLDKFKRVNDNLGHAVGDRVLQVFTTLLTETTRAYDTVARMGGEEFMILCPGLDVVEARALAQRICDALPEVCREILNDRYRQTVSVGIALYPQHAVFGPALTDKADAALYQAKRDGRNRAVVAGPGSEAPTGAGAGGRRISR